MSTLCHRCNEEQGIHHFEQPDGTLLLSCQYCLTQGEATVVALCKILGVRVP
jgi:hypothetical protein